MTLPSAPIQDKPRLSFTQLSMWLKCPRSWMYRYRDGIKTPASGAMVQSRAWHSTVELNYRQKIESDADLPLSEMTSFFATELDTAFEAEEVKLNPGETQDALKDQGVGIVTAHHKTIAPNVRPLLVEEQFVISLGDNFPYDLMGYWDLVERDGTIADNKAHKKTPRQDDLDKDLQFTAYALAFRVREGKPEKQLRMDYVVKTKTPKAGQLWTRRTNHQCRWFLELVEQMVHAIQAETFFPNPTSYLCDPKWCGYYADCQGRVSPFTKPRED